MFSNFVEHFILRAFICAVEALKRYIRLNNEINHALLTAGYYLKTLKVSANYYS
jgi:hypothetical protein